MRDTEEGIAILLRPEFRNAYWPIFFKVLLLANEIVCSWPQSLNTPVFIYVIKCGNSKVTRPEPENAYLPSRDKELLLGNLTLFK